MSAFSGLIEKIVAGADPPATLKGEVFTNI
jgi:hypothetical protein